MILTSIFLLLQYSTRSEMQKSVESAILFGRIIGGTFLTRVISLVLVLILAFLIMRRNKLKAIVVAHGVTFLFCAVMLGLALLKPRETVVNTPTADGRFVMAESGKYPFNILLIYSICISVWFLIDYGFATLIKKTTPNPTAPNGEIKFGERKKIVPEEGENFPT